MEFENSFSVHAPIDRVWRYLLDVESVAPCVPGAQLTEVVSETEFKGTVKIKLGAVQVSYRGTVQLRDVDEAAHRVVLSATGSETRGTGGASGTVTSTLIEDGSNRTTVTMLSEITVTGRVAQFGRNIMQDVSSRLIREFAKCLEAALNEPAPAGDKNSDELAGPTAAPSSAPPTARSSTSQDSTSPARATSDAEAAQRQPALRTPTVVPAHDADNQIKVLPLLLDIGRSRLAQALRRLALALDPER